MTIVIKRSPKTRYREARHLTSWVGNPYLRAAKVYATMLCELGFRGKALEVEVRRMFPAIDIEAGREIPPGTIAQRGDKGFRYPREHYSAMPDGADLVVRIWQKLVLGKTWRRIVWADWSDPPW